MKTIHIKVFHDTVCPWCRIGKKNLLIALKELNLLNTDFEIKYYTFFLHRDLGREGVDYEQYLTSKFGGVPLNRINEGPTRLGKQVGIEFNFNKIKKIPNTIASHILIHLTPDKEKEQIIDKLTESYFEKGQDIGNIDVLTHLASELGIQITPDQLREDKNIEEVLQEDEYGKKLGITGVPFFIFEDKYALSGAQSISTFKNVIQRTCDDVEILL